MNAAATVHGVLARVDGCGVLITGAAGSGKSQLGLELLRAGHAIVADDQVRLQSRDDGIHGTAEAAGAGFLALRCGVIVDIVRHYGPDALLDSCRIDCSVTPGPALTPFSETPSITLLGRSIPQYFLHALAGSSVCVEAIARAWALRQEGHDAAQILAARQADKLQAG